MIALRGVGKSFGGRVLFRSLELTFAPGRTTVITGRSGAGKSTLLRLLNQLERHDEGTVVLDGLEIPAGLPEREWRRRADLLRRRTGMLFQSHHLFPHLTVLQNVMLAPVHVKRVAAAEARTRALALLEQVGLAAAAERYPARLSGGESQRVAIARALAMAPEVLLLDEPTASLDPQSTRDVVAAIQDLRRRGITQVLVTHHPELAAELGDQRVNLDRVQGTA